jgi:exosortase D (VPLPA-CTERM-specific)
LFWDMRSRLNGLVLRNYWAVLPLLIIIILISLYGILGSSGNVSRPAIPILVVLFFIFCFGMDAFKRFYLPLCFLIFIVPLPAFLDTTIGVFLKSLSSKLGGFFINACGLSVNVSGNIIDLGVTRLQVVDACSGLRFLFPLFALGVVYAYFFEKVKWKRIVCVIATIPIAILANGLRIGATGVLSEFFGPAAAQGFFHDFSGWVIFLVAFGFLFVLGWMLRLLPSKIAISPGATKRASKVDGFPQWTGRNPALIISIGLLLVVGILSLVTDSMPPVMIKGNIDSFPMAINEWIGERDYLKPEIIKRSGAEEAFSATYHNATGERVSLYLGYRQSAFLENENFFHSPTVCLPAAGWENKGQSRHYLENMPFEKKFSVTQMVIEQMNTRELVYFWFQTKDQATYNKNINRLHLALHALKNDNTYDLFIRLVTPIKMEEKIDDAQRRLDGFAKEMMVTLLKFINKNQYMGNEINS